MDLFEDIDEVLEYSDIPAPDFNASSFKSIRMALPYSQEAKKFTLLDRSIELEPNWDNYIISLSQPPSPHFTDYFSKRHLREKISALMLQINQNSPSDISDKKKEANPYSLLKSNTKEFKYPGISRMANIIKLFPELIEKNYAIPVYQFLTLGDKGGLSEYIVHQYQSQFLEELSGWALFPRSNFKVDSVTNKNEGEINFETIQNFAESLLKETPDPSLMLIISELSWKEKDSVLEEKYMKLYLSYSLYLSVRLLARGGNVIIKLYNTSQPATIEMIYIISSLFTSISLIKPISSPPHSPSRILIGLDYKGSEDITVYESLCKTLERLIHLGKDLDHVLAFSKVLKHDKFQDYIMNQNSAIAESNIIALQRVLDYLQDTGSVKTVQKIDKEELYEKCLIDWKLKNYTEEQKREILEDFNIAPIRSFNIRNEKPQDISGIKDIVYRYSTDVKDIKLKNSARKKPEEIVSERSLDIQQLVKPDAAKSIDSLRFLKLNTKKTRKTTK